MSSQRKRFRYPAKSKTIRIRKRRQSDEKPKRIGALTKKEAPLPGLKKVLLHVAKIF